VASVPDNDAMKTLRDVFPSETRICYKPPAVSLLITETEDSCPVGTEEDYGMVFDVGFYQETSDICHEPVISHMCYHEAILLDHKK
jgi:hypothetical protein